MLAYGEKTVFSWNSSPLLTGEYTHRDIQMSKHTRRPYQEWSQGR